MLITSSAIFWSGPQ